MEHRRGEQLEKEGHKACMQKEACDHIYIYIRKRWSRKCVLTSISMESSMKSRFNFREDKIYN